MSRSKRKTPIAGRASHGSEAYDKKQWHSKWRSKERISLRQAIREGAMQSYIPIHRYQVSNPWDFAKDGKWYLTPADANLNDSSISSPRERKMLRLRALHKLLSK